MNRPVTTIRWRPYPEEKPPKAGWYTVLLPAQVIERQKFIPDREGTEWPYMASNRIDKPLAFALPSDITTVQPPVTNNKGEG